MVKLQRLCARKNLSTLVWGGEKGGESGGKLGSPRALPKTKKKKKKKKATNFRKRGEAKSWWDCGWKKERPQQGSEGGSKERVVAENWKKKGLTVKRIVTSSPQPAQGGQPGFVCRFYSKEPGGIEYWTRPPGALDSREKEKEPIETPLNKGNLGGSRRNSPHLARYQSKRVGKVYVKPQQNTDHRKQWYPSAQAWQKLSKSFGTEEKRKKVEIAWAENVKEKFTRSSNHKKLILSHA